MTGEASPNSLIPGESMMKVSGAISNISAKVVVCTPLFANVETSEVRKSKSGAIALTKVDFPTPECPEISETFPFRILKKSSTILATTSSI